jgi:hypothetical protein
VGFGFFVNFCDEFFDGQVEQSGGFEGVDADRAGLGRLR